MEKIDDIMKMKADIEGMKAVITALISVLDPSERDAFAERAHQAAEAYADGLLAGQSPDWQIDRMQQVARLLVAASQHL